MTYSYHGRNTVTSSRAPPGAVASTPSHRELLVREIRTHPKLVRAAMPSRQPKAKVRLRRRRTGKVRRSSASKVHAHVGELLVDPRCAWLISGNNALRCAPNG